MLAKRASGRDPLADVFNLDLFSDWEPYRRYVRAEQQHRELVSDDSGTLEVDLPGVKPSDVDVTVEGSLVKVKYARGATGGALSWQISEAFDIEGVTARMEHGVLSLDFPRAKKARGRKVEVLAK